MTFPMSENKSIKILMDDESSEENQKSAKEIEDDKRAEKEAQQKLVSVCKQRYCQYYNIQPKYSVVNKYCLEY